MSEYQYYEFVAIDQPLSADEQADLRAISTRALITPTSFVNHYEWGDLKADPRRLVERYFDAFLYLANWGTHRLMFRLPTEVFDASAEAVVNRYLVGDGSTAWTTGGYIVIELFADDEDGEYNQDWLDGSGLLASIVPVRAELMAGDLRLLYLAWLLAVQNREVDEHAVEPPVPPGLGQLSAALSAVASSCASTRILSPSQQSAVRHSMRTTRSRRCPAGWRSYRRRARTHFCCGSPGVTGRRCASNCGLAAGGRPGRSRPATVPAGPRRICSRSPGGAAKTDSVRLGSTPSDGQRSAVAPLNVPARIT